MLLYGRDPGANKEYIDKKLAEYKETYANPIYEISSNINVQDIVEPEQTRRYLIQSLQVLSRKNALRHPKKHGNMPM